MATQTKGGRPGRRSRPARGPNPVLYVTAPTADWIETGLAPLRERYEIVVDDRAERLRAVVERVEVVLSLGGTRELLEPVFGLAARLRWIHMSSAGIESLIFPALVDSQVVVTNASALFSDEIAEHALAQILALAKRLPDNVRDQAERRWRVVPAISLAGKRLGIVGLGAIGQALASRARCLGMSVVGTRRSAGKPVPGVERIYTPGELVAMMGECDVVAVSIPHTPETTELIGETELRAMKPGSYFVNVARGDVVDEEALRQVLVEGRIAGCASDVFQEEPLPANSPWYDTPNVMITPHSAAGVIGGEEKVIRLFLENVERYERGRTLKNVVDLRAGY